MWILGEKYIAELQCKKANAMGKWNWTLFDDFKCVDLLSKQTHFEHF